jgi:methylmalonyl-CoA mutase N-terminal domain/subunit
LNTDDRETADEQDDDAAPSERRIERIAGERVTRVHATDSRLPLAAAYTATDWQPRAEQPGDYPFTRGITPDGYRSELWHRDLYAGFGNAEDSSERYAQLLQGGASGVNIALDLPTQLGYDSDHPDAIAETGKVGLAVDSFQDILDLFSKIKLRAAHTVFTVGNGIGPMALAWFMLLGESQGIEPSDYVIHLQNDPLKEFTGRGAFVFPLGPSIRLACDVVEYVARKKYLHWKPIGICGSQYRWGGGNAIQEVGLAMASARCYIEELLQRGLAIDEFGPLLELHLAADMDILEEAAKFRAARRVWARMMKEDYGAKLPASQQLRVSLYTGGYRLTAHEPLNNAVRITLQALGAVLGGVQHLGTLSIDEALSTPSSEASRLAIQTQNILAFETSLPASADPLGGSYLVESLTDQLEGRIQALMSDVANRGGVLQALRQGYLQTLLDHSAYEYQKDIDSGERVVVGVNSFRQPTDSVSSVSTFRIKDASASRQIERLLEFRRQRDTKRAASALEHLERQARGPSNLVGPIKDAFAAGATIGEVCDRLRTVFGTWRDDGVTL